MSPPWLELESLVDFAGTAEWRRRKADEFPDDERNVKAAELLEMLAEQATFLEENPLHRRIMGLYETKDSIRFGETVSAHLRSVGFWYFPDNAAAFFQYLIEALEDLKENEEAA